MTPCCPNHTWTPSHAVGIWTEPFEQYAHSLGLASGEQRQEIRFFCSSDPENMAMVARHAEGQRTHELCRPSPWVSDSLTLWIWVQQVVIFRLCRGLEEGVSALAALPNACKRWLCDLAEALWGCRLAPMDSQGVQEVVCAQHCP